MSLKKVKLDPSPGLPLCRRGNEGEAINAVLVTQRTKKRKGSQRKNATTSVTADLNSWDDRSEEVENRTSAGPTFLRERD